MTRHRTVVVPGDMIRAYADAAWMGAFSAILAVATVAIAAWHWEAGGIFGLFTAASAGLTFVVRHEAHRDLMLLLDQQREEVRGDRA